VSQLPWHAWQRAELLKLLNPPAAKHAECQAHIESTLSEVAKAKRAAALQPKPNLDRAEDKALRKLLVANRANMAAGGMPAFPPGEIQRRIDAHKKWKPPFPKKPKEPRWIPLPKTHGQYTAAVLSRELLRRWRPGEKIVTTSAAGRKGNWWHAARILFGKHEGERGADLYPYLLRVRAERKALARLLRDERHASSKSL
jgi:hypothetical protein